MSNSSVGRQCPLTIIQFRHNIGQICSIQNVSDTVICKFTNSTNSTGWGVLLLLCCSSSQQVVAPHNSDMQKTHFDRSMEFYTCTQSVQFYINFMIKCVVLHRACNFTYNALCGYPLVKWKLEIQARQHPFSCSPIISVEIWNYLAKPPFQMFW